MIEKKKDSYSIHTPYIFNLLVLVALTLVALALRDGRLTNGVGIFDHNLLRFFDRFGINFYDINGTNSKFNG